MLLVKCVARGGKGHGGFQWPQSGPVACPQALAGREGAARATGDEQVDCASGGLFGWAWGVNLGGGKEPDYRGDWIVFAAKPEDVVSLGDKQKAVGECDVVYYGDALGAMIHTLEGRVAWVEHNSAGSASATGGSGSASATGESGSASATGGRGSASATGESGSASATGWRGSASATGESGSASATGWSGSASATGESGSASATGESGSASATGERGIAALAGEYGTIEVGPAALGAVTAECWRWRVRQGAVVAWRWEGAAGLLVADDLGLADGAEVTVKAGRVLAAEEQS